MRRALPFAILGACLVVGVLPALAADQSVAIHDFRYAPVDVAVMPGETVTWKADGAYMHNVHLDGETTALGPASTMCFRGSTLTCVASSWIRGAHGRSSSSA